MVFIALPALQRSQRNQQYKNNLSLVASAIQNYKSNNRGQNPPPTGTNGYYPGKTTATDVGMSNHPMRSYFDAIDFTTDIDSVKIFTNNGAVKFDSGWWAVSSRIIVILDKTCPENAGSFRTITLQQSPGKVAALVLLDGINTSQPPETRDAQVYCQNI